MATAGSLDGERFVRARVGASVATIEALLAGAHAHDIAAAATRVAEALRAGGKVLLFGNGGSAADAQHIAAELVGRFDRERAALAAVALPDATAAVTAIANDYGFDAAFARQVEALARPGDVAIAISTSGDSENVLAGVRAAAKAGLPIVALTGADGGQLAGLVDLCVRAPAHQTARIQEAHAVVGHVLCELVERELFPDAPHAWRVPRRGARGDGVIPRSGRFRRSGWPTAVFLDRDGTINRKPPANEYVTSWDGFEFLPGAKEGLRLLTELMIPLIVVTNQRGIARGRMSEADLRNIHARMLRELQAAGVRVSAVYYCPHDRGECSCRKPGAGMLAAAERELGGIELARSVLIGDSEADMEAASRVGASCIRIAGAPDSTGRLPTDFVAVSLWEAAVWLWRPVADLTHRPRGSRSARPSRPDRLEPAQP